MSALLLSVHHSHTYPDLLFLLLYLTDSTQTHTLTCTQSQSTSRSTPHTGMASTDTHIHSHQTAAHPSITFRKSHSFPITLEMLMQPQAAFNTQATVMVP